MSPRGEVLATSSAACPATSTATTSASATASATGATTGASAATVLSATQAFLGTLDDAQKESVLGDRMQANLSQWSNLPDQLFERAGLRMDSLNADQQAGVQKILQAALSPEGYAQVSQITTADGVLATQGGPNLDFGADHYWIRILRAPASGPWTFAWFGSTQIGNPIYYRVQGPTCTIEFAHQQGQGANAGGITHIHSIYREPGNDYGAQLAS